MDVQLDLTSPNNCDHIHVTVSSDKGQRSFVFVRPELVAEATSLDELTEEQVRMFLQAKARDESLTTLAEFKTALEGKTHKI